MQYIEHVGAAEEITTFSLLHIMEALPFSTPESVDVSSSREIAAYDARPKRKPGSIDMSASPIDQSPEMANALSSLRRCCSAVDFRQHSPVPPIDTSLFDGCDSTPPVPHVPRHATRRHCPFFPKSPRSVLERRTSSLSDC